MPWPLLLGWAPVGAAVSTGTTQEGTVPSPCSRAPQLSVWQEQSPLSKRRLLQSRCSESQCPSQASSHTDTKDGQGTPETGHCETPLSTRSGDLGGQPAQVERQEAWGLARGQGGVVAKSAGLERQEGSCPG